MGMIIFAAYMYGILKEQSKENNPPPEKNKFTF